MSVLGPNDPRGVVREATKAEADAARPKGLPKDRGGLVLGTGEIAFRVYGGPDGKETEAVLKGMAEDWAARDARRAPRKARKNEGWGPL